VIILPHGDRFGQAHHQLDLRPRIVGQAHDLHLLDLADLDPFVHLDQMGEVEYAPGEPKGTPWHPHRGFETVTYMIDGRMRHQDTTGGGGVLRSGGVQWMTAGRGIVHSEMPEQEDGLMKGLQLWVNLPARDKMTAPRYQNIEPEDVPEVTRDDGAKIRVVAGSYDGVAGAVGEIAVEPLYVDVGLPAGARVEIPVPAGHAAFLYPFEGVVMVGADGSARPVADSEIAVLSDGENVTLTDSDDGGRGILVAGRPIGEPIARHGPFVMNTREEIMQAFQDYEAGRF
jgi:redox-sensitive bicupin YhaK (pirin superfamily)